MGYRSAYRPSYRPTYNRGGYNRGYNSRPSAPKVNLLQQEINKAPASTADKDVFKWNRAWKKFDINFTSSKFNNSITKAEIDGMNNEIQTYRLSNGNDSPLIVVGICLGLLLFVLGLISYILNLVKGNILFALLSFFGGFCCIFFCVALFVGCSQGQVKKELKERENRLRLYFNSKNPSYSHKGIEFSVGPSGAWFALEVKDRSKLGSQPQGSGVTNNNNITIGTNQNRTNNNNAVAPLPLLTPINRPVRPITPTVNRPVPMVPNEPVRPFSRNNNNHSLYEPQNIGVAEVIPTSNLNSYRPPVSPRYGDIAPPIIDVDVPNRNNYDDGLEIVGIDVPRDEENRIEYAKGFNYPEM